MNALSHRKQQKGAVLVLVTIALFTLLGFTALALDGGYLLLNKTRVQDAVDSAALSGAKTLDDGGTLTEAEDAVKKTLEAVFSGEGFSKINIDTAQLDTDLLKVDFSLTVEPFTSTYDSNARYIRVALGNIPVTQFFSQLLLDTWKVWASAVAGPSPPIKENCQQIPLLMCAGDVENIGEEGYNFGFTPSSETERGNVLVIKSPNHNATANVGPGNFLALDLGVTGGGADEFREGLAGNIHDDQCISPGDTVRTKAGNMIGPTAQGLNTRFGEYKDPMREPVSIPSEGGSGAYYADCEVPDYSGTNLELINFTGTEFDTSAGSSVLNDTDYLGKLQDYPDYNLGIDGGSKSMSSTPTITQQCVPKRRLVGVPVADCTGYKPGSGDLPSLGTACMFLIQQVTGDTGKDQFIVAEFVKNCTAEGSGYTNTSNFRRLVLYKDYGSNGGS